MNDQDRARKIREDNNVKMIIKKAEEYSNEEYQNIVREVSTALSSCKHLPSEFVHEVRKTGLDKSEFSIKQKLNSYYLEEILKNLDPYYLPEKS